MPCGPVQVMSQNCGQIVINFGLYNGGCSTKQCSLVTAWETSTEISKIKIHFIAKKKTVLVVPHDFITNNCTIYSFCNIFCVSLVTVSFNARITCYQLVSMFHRLQGAMGLRNPV